MYSATGSPPPTGRSGYRNQRGPRAVLGYARTPEFGRFTSTPLGDRNLGVPRAKSRGGSRAVLGYSAPERSRRADTKAEGWRPKSKGGPRAESRGNFLENSSIIPLKTRIRKRKFFIFGM